MTRNLAALALLGLVGCSSAHVPGRARVASLDGGVSITVDAPRGVELWRRGATGAAPVCVAPCAADIVPEGNVFEARVRDMPDSPPMTLPASRKLLMKVETAPRVLMGLGVVTATAGSMAMVIGGVLIGMDQSGNRDLSGASLAGGITAAAGSAVLAAGIVLAALSGTRVEVTEVAERGVVRF